MSNAYVTIKISNLTHTEDKLQKLIALTHNLTPAMEAIGKELEHFYSEDVFNSEGGALGKKWQELAESTRERKAVEFPGRGILERTGTLRRSFYSEVTPLSVFISNNAETPDGRSLFAIHQLGTSEGKGRGHNIPARPMIGLNESTKAIIRQIITDEIKLRLV